MTSTAAAASPPVMPVRIVPGRGRIDLAGAERAATGFLAALGVATDGAAMADTPRRMAQAYAEMLSPRSFDPRNHGPVRTTGRPAERRRPVSSLLPSPDSRRADHTVGIPNAAGAASISSGFDPPTGRTMVRGQVA